MKIKIDYREKQLVEHIDRILKSNPKLQKNTTYELVSLEIGDISICYDKNNENDSNEKEKEILLIERKTVNDLASSIVDKRYNEQSHRLSNCCSLQNHNIIYLIEGNVLHVNMRYSRITPTALYSAMAVLQYHKGFSVFRTFNVSETAEYILRTADKIHREQKKGYYDDDDNDDDISNDTDNSHNIIEKTQIVDPNKTSSIYCVKKKRSDNITPENIGEIMLSQIPGVSSKIGSTIIKNFDSISNLIENINNNPKCLDDIYIESANGNKRKLNSTVKNNLINFLTKKENSIIDCN